jgi:hypothetical protein
MLGLATHCFRAANFNGFRLRLVGAIQRSRALNAVSPASVGVNCVDEPVRHLVLLLVATITPYPRVEFVNPVAG